MEQRDAIGFERKLKQKEKELENSPPHSAQSGQFKKIQNDYNNNQFNLNDKASLYNISENIFKPYHGKIKEGKRLLLIDSDYHGNLRTHSEALEVFLFKIDLIY